MATTQQQMALLEDDLIVAMKNAGLYYDKDLTEENIPQAVLNLVPKDVCLTYHLMPIAVDNDVIILVTDSSEAIRRKGDISRRLKYPVYLRVSEPENVKAGLAKFYDIQSYRISTRRSADNTASDDEDALRRKVKDVLNWCIDHKASDVHFIPYSNGIFVKVRQNGFVIDISDQWAFYAEDAKKVVNILKSMDESNSASVQLSRMPNSGHFVIFRGDMPVECRLQTNPIGDVLLTREHANIRFLPQNKRVRNLDSIYHGDDLKAIKQTLYKGGAGMYLLSGPVGTGKSTSIQAMQEYVRTLYSDFGHDLIIFEIQNPIEYVDERNIQVEERLADDASLSLDAMTALRSALRSDPDIIVYGEIRDSSDAQVATKACQTGLRMFSTIHAGDCIRTINRLLDLDVSRMSLLAELKLIVCQRLLGRLCPNCSKPHTLTEEEKSVLTDEEIQMLEASSGLRERGSAVDIAACKCQNGLVGRVAVPEYIIFNDALRNALLHMDAFDAVPQVLQSHGFRSMWSKGLMMAACGQAELSDVIQKIGRG